MPLGPSPTHIKRVSSVVLWLSNNPFQARPGIPGSAVPHQSTGQDRSEVGGDHTPLPSAVKPQADFFLLSQAFTHPTRAQMHRRYRSSPFQGSIFTPKKRPVQTGRQKTHLFTDRRSSRPTTATTLTRWGCRGCRCGLGCSGPGGLGRRSALRSTLHLLQPFARREGESAVGLAGQLPGRVA